MFSFISQVTQLPDPSVGSLPLAAHILALLGLVGGLVLWLVGQKVIKPVFGVLGGVIGGLIGFLTMPSIAPSDIGGIPSPYLGLGIGAVFGLGAGLMLFRFAVAISTGIALGLAGILISAASIHFTPVQDASKNLNNLKNSAIKAAQSPIDPTLTSKKDQAMARAQPVAQTVKEFVESEAEDIRASWNSLQGHEQVVLGLSGVGGMVAGFFIGLFFPRKSAAVATSLFGSAVWVPSLMWLANALEVPGREYLDRGAMFWLIVWMVAAIVGIGVQIGGQRRKPAPQQ
jgi:hypothetical protein